MSEEDTKQADAQLEQWRQEAESGSVQHMTSLAKHYLALAKSGADTAENGKNAINWLIKASQNVDDEATELLKTCLEEKIGITSENLEQVRWCLRTSELDKSVRVAARKLFNDLKSGKDTNLSKAAFLEGVKKASNEEDGRKLLEAMGKHMLTDDGVSEEDFVNFMADRLKVGGSFQDEIELEAWSQAPMSSKLTTHSDTSISVFLDGFLEFLSTDMVNIVMSIIPWDEFNVLVFFFIFSILSFAFLYRVIVMATFYVAFLLMVTTTARMVKEKRNLQDVITLSRVLKRYSATVDDEEAVAAHTRKSMTPYWTFFSALIVAVPSFAYTQKGWVPCAEMAVLSLFLSGVCLVIMCDLSDPMILGGLAVELYAALPVILSDFPEIPLISDLIWLLTDTLFSIELLDGIYFNFGLPALAYMALPVMFYYMACKSERSWQGVYTALVPFLVSFLWWNTSIMFFTHSTYMNMVQGSLGWVGFIIFFPFVAAWAFIKGAWGFLMAFSLGYLLKFLVALVLLAIPIAISLWKEEGFGIGDMSLRGKSLKAKMLAFLVPVFIAIILVFSPEPSGVPPEDKYVSWDLYKETCSKPAWDKDNMAAVVMRCHHFRFMTVAWSGTVNNVIISSVDNPAEKFLDVLPEGLGEWLKCMYGEKYDDCDEEKMTQTEHEACKLRGRYSRECHVSKHAELSFLVSVKVKVDDVNTQDVTLTAGDEYRDVLLRLKPGDSVQFRGSLSSGMGSPKLQLGLAQIECTTCTEPFLQEEEPESLMDRTVDALLHTFNFVFAPLVEYRKPAPAAGSTTAQEDTSPAAQETTDTDGEIQSAAEPEEPQPEAQPPVADPVPAPEEPSEEVPAHESTSENPTPATEAPPTDAPEKTEEEDSWF